MMLQATQARATAQVRPSLLTEAVMTFCTCWLIGAGAVIAHRIAI